MAVNTVNNTIESYVTDNDSVRSDVKLTDGGAVRLRADDTTEIIANAGGLSFAGAGGGKSGSAGSFGGSIAVNTITNKTRAYVNNSEIDAKGLGSAPDQIDFLSGAVDDADDSIDFGAAHGLQTGDTLSYENRSAGDAVMGLQDGGNYYAIVDGYDFNPFSAVDSSSDQIELEEIPGYADNDAVIYYNGGGDSIGGLEDGKV